MTTIKLACGLELKATWNTGEYEVPKFNIRFREFQGGSCKSYFLADSEFGTRDECLSWLSTRVEELVASLGAVIVPGDAHSKVRAVLDVPALADVDVDDLASAVLAALGLVKP